jgi:predicted nucleic acid-binding protein
VIETCADACCLINLNNGAVLEKIATAGHRKLVYQGLVEDELHSPAAAVRKLTAEGALTRISGSNIFASEISSIIRKYDLGLGESECIAIGVKYGMVVASDDGKARAAASNEVGRARVTGSIGLLKEAVSTGALTSGEAYRAYSLMVGAGAFFPTLAANDF